MNSYQNPEFGQAYLDYLASPDGLLQQKILREALLEYLPDMRTIRVLDAACGNGWMTQILAEKYDQVQGFDNSEFLLDKAKRAYPDLSFSQADLIGDIPYPDGFADLCVLNMAASDTHDLKKMYTNLSRITKPGGKLIATIPNPYYAFPVGVWKRGFLGWLLKQKPSLRLRPWAVAAKIKLTRSNTFSGHFYSLADQTKNAKLAGFALTTVSEIKSSSDSDLFDLRYRLYRYPLFLLLEFIKLGK